MQSLDNNASRSQFAADSGEGRLDKTVVDKKTQVIKSGGARSSTKRPAQLFLRRLSATTESVLVEHCE